MRCEEREDHELTPSASLIQVQVYASPVRARSDSFASSFPHFATKLISTAAAESTDSFPEAARYNERRLRAANSTPDIKALFDSPAHSTHNYTTSSTASPLATSSLYPSPYHESRSSDLWGAPRQMVSRTKIYGCAWLRLILC